MWGYVGVGWEDVSNERDLSRFKVWWNVSTKGEILKLTRERMSNQHSEDPEKTKGITLMKKEVSIIILTGSKMERLREWVCMFSNKF